MLQLHLFRGDGTVEMIENQEVCGVEPQTGGLRYLNLLHQLFSETKLQ